MLLPPRSVVRTPCRTAGTWSWVPRRARRDSLMCFAKPDSRASGAPLRRPSTSSSRRDFSDTETRTAEALATARPGASDFRSPLFENRRHDARTEALSRIKSASVALRALAHILPTARACADASPISSGSVTWLPHVRP
jgi:hypothetical protein